MSSPRSGGGPHPASPHPAGWPLAALVQLVLGVVAVIPVWLAWYALSNFPLAALGLTGRDPNENDGILPVLLVGVPVWLGFLLLWSLANHGMRNWTRLPARPYWTAAVVLALLPTGLLIALSALT